MDYLLMLVAVVIIIIRILGLFVVKRKRVYSKR